MNHKIIFVVVAFVISILLDSTAIASPLTGEYLMNHPDELQARLKAVESRQKSYTECVGDSVANFVNSTENADTIAEGALGNCGNAKSEYLRAIIDAGAGQNAPELGNALDAKLHKWAVSLVLNYRTLKMQKSLSANAGQSKSEHPLPTADELYASAVQESEHTQPNYKAVQPHLSFHFNISDYIRIFDEGARLPFIPFISMVYAPLAPLAPLFDAMIETVKREGINIHTLNAISDSVRLVMDILGLGLLATIGKRVRGRWGPPFSKLFRRRS